MSVEGLIESYGYVAVVAGTLVQSETVLVVGGFIAHQGHLALLWVIVAASLGSFAGNELYFYLGRRHADFLLRRNPQRQRRIEEVQALLKRYRYPVVLGFRFLYGLRTLMAIAIGMSRISSGLFVLLNLIGALVWGVFFGLAGYLSGRALRAVMGNLERYELELAGLVVAVSVLVWVLRSWHRRRSLVLLCLPLVLVSCASQEAQDPGPATSIPGLRAGVSRVDITPTLGIGMFGMADPTQIAAGIHTRLNATALVLEDAQGHKGALVVCDLLVVTQALRTEVLKKIAGTGIEEANLLLCATHTHSGPGGYLLYPLYNFGIGLKPSVFHFLVERIALAVQQADEARVPAVLGVDSVDLSNVTRNRSIEAHLANHGLDLERGQGSPDLDPQGALHTIDPRMRGIRVDRVESGTTRPLAFLANFAVHATLLKHDNRLYSGDLHGAAVRLFEQRFRSAAVDSASADGVLCLFSNAAEGDISPCIRDGYRGMGYNSLSDAEISGRKHAEAMAAIFARLEGRLADTVTLDSRLFFVILNDRQIAGSQHRTSSKVGFGLPMIGGAEDGPSVFHDLLGTEGARTSTDDPYQGRKVVILSTPPALLMPGVVPLQIVRIGDILLAAVPGEPTLESGRRIQERILRNVIGLGIREVWIVGLGNEYPSYLATPEEYRMQHYEGGSTIFGPWQEPLVEQEFGKLAEAMAAGLPAPDTGVAPPDLTDRLRRAEGRERRPPPDDLAAVGRVISEPGEASRFEVVSFRWVGGNPYADHHPGEAFVTVQQEGKEDEWTDLLTDDSLEVIVRAKKQNEEYVWEARWELRGNVPSGRFRFQVRGKALGEQHTISYGAVSRPFGVSVSGALRVTGLERVDPGLLLRAAYPPPDPQLHFLYRESEVRTGSVDAKIGDQILHASYDPESQGFLLPATLEPGQNLVVDPGGLQDQWGNFNQERFSFSGTP